MTDPKFTIGSLWKTRGGWKAMVVDIEKNGEPQVYHYQEERVKGHHPDGRYMRNTPSEHDLLTPWVEPKIVRAHGWVNVYKKPCHGSAIGFFSASKDQADTYGYGRIACKELDFTVVEGEGL